MNTQTPFNLSPGHFAQPAVETKAAAFSGQNMIDAFAECDMATCNKLAALLANGRHAEVGRLMEKVVIDWCEPN